MDIFAENVTKAYGARVVLGAFSLSLKAGTWLSLIGVSGSGKSTLLNILAGIAEPDSGRLSVGGVASAADRAARVAYLLQSFPLYPSLTVDANLTLAESRRRVASGPSKTSIIDMLRLESCLQQLPSQLSGGERQRAALARTLMLNREVLLLDEPFSNVDVVLRRELRRHIRRLQRDYGWTTILVTHDQEDAISTSDLAGFLAEGHVMQLDKPETLFSRPVSMAVGANVGDVGMVRIPAEALTKSFGLDALDAEDFLIRECDFEVSTTARDGHALVTVTDSEYLGSRTRIFADLAGATVSFMIPDARPTCGATFWIRPNKERLTPLRRVERV